MAIKKKSVSKWKKFPDSWKPYIEPPASLEDIDEIMVGASIPTFAYYFMLLLSAVIATFGLLSNSAPAIIGAMIIAPLMAPIVSLSYSINIFDWKLARRSILTIITGAILVIVFSYLCTRLIGIRIAGSEILSRTSPTLLDLGIAMAAGAAAAFSYTRKNIINSIAGVAIAVALVPPLTVTGIGLAYGRLAASEVGLSLTELGHYSGGVDIAIGSFVLFTTNFLGIILIACIVLLSQGYGQWKKAGIGLLTVLVASVIIIDPLNKALYKLAVKSEVLALAVALPNKYPQMFSRQGRLDAIHVSYYGDILHVNIESTVPKLGLTSEEMKKKAQIVTDLLKENLKQKLKTPVVVNLDIIPVELFSVSAGGEYLDPVGFKSPSEVEEENSNTNFE